MKTVLLKSTLSSFTLQNPAYNKVGIDGDAITYKIINVPENISAQNVLLLTDKTCLVSPDKRNYTYKYDELGKGKIVL